MTNGFNVQVNLQLENFRDGQVLTLKFNIGNEFEKNKKADLANVPQKIK